MDQERINAYNTEQKKKVDEQSAKKLQKDNAGLVVSAVTGSAGVVAGTVRDAAQKTEKATKEVSQSVTTAGKDIIQAVTNSQNEVATALNNLVVATIVSKDPQLLQAAKDVSNLLTSIAKAGNDFKSSKLNVLPESLNKLSSSIQSLVDNKTSDTDIDYTSVLNDIKDLLSVDDKTPVINVAAPKVMIDTTKFEKAITSLEKAVRENIVTLPEQDDTAVIEALAGVKGSIDNMTFPVPNYVLPFKDINGAAIQVQLDASGNLPTTGGGGGGTQYADGAARGTATGTIAMVDDGTNIQSMAGTAAGVLKVDISATTANATAIKVDGSAVTQPTSQVAATIPTATTMQNTAVAIANGTNLNVSGYSAVVLSITGTFVATIAFEASVDDTTFVAITAHQIGTAGSLVTTSTTTGDFRINSSAYKSIRARISAYTSGSITVKGYASPTSGNTHTVNANVLTSALPTMPTTLISFITTVTTAGVRVNLASNTVVSGFLIQAPSTNTGNIYVGGSTVSASVFGTELQPGQSSAIAVNNTNLVWIDSSVNGGKLSVIGS